MNKGEKASPVTGRGRLKTTVADAWGVRPEGSAVSLFYMLLRRAGLESDFGSLLEPK